MKKTDHVLVQNVLDGNISREEFDAFQQRLREDDGLAELYRTYALLHHTLHEEFEVAPSPHSISPPGRRVSRSAILALILILVPVIATALFLTKPWHGFASVENAGLASFSLDAVWQIEGPSHPAGSATGLPFGTSVRLMQGRTDIQLTPSIIAHVEGPAEFSLLSPNTVRLVSGLLYLDAAESQDPVTISTPLCDLTGRGAHFGIDASATGVIEAHVTQGALAMNARSGSMTIQAGNACRVTGDSPAVAVPMRQEHFPTHLGRFRPVPLDVFNRQAWQITHGNPTFSQDRIEGVNYSIFQELSPASPDFDVLLVTVETGKPAVGNFHTDGWSGISLFQDGWEQVFFGDAFGGPAAWSLDVKNREPIVPSKPLLTGPAKVTFRYHRRTGRVSLHQGGFPLSPPIAAATIRPGLHFDQIRLAASTDAALTINAVSIRSGGN